MNKKHICPVCGFEGLRELPYDALKNPSHEICPCCGFEFGFDDREKYSDYRKKWIENGSKWFLPEEKPKDWNLEKQLKNIPST